MSIINYCCEVQAHVKHSKPDPATNDELMEWFGDTGRAATAVTRALEGKTSKALSIAEPLAEKYNLP